jgi:WD40 repeat protein
VSLPRRSGGSRHRCRVSPDGKRIVTASDDHTARTYTCALCGSVYELARLADKQLVHICALLTVRERYLGG